MDLDAYLSRPGAESMASFARACGFNADQVRQWRHGHDDRRPGPESCAVMERESQGLVTCEELRPDLAWRRFKDATWLWHRKGKPYVELVAA